MWLWTSSAPCTRAVITRSTDIACSAARCGSLPTSASHARCATTPGVRALGAPAVHGQLLAPRELARQVLDVHAGPAVDLGRVLAREQRDAHRLGLHDVALADHDDAAVRHGEALRVGLEVDADLRPGVDVDVLVDDRALDDRAAADLHARHQHGVLDRRVGVDVHAGREHRAAHLAAGDDHAGAHHRVQRVAHALLVGEHELRRGQRLLPGEDRPLAVVEVEHRVDRDQVHVRLPERVERPDVAPVAAVARRRARHLVLGEVVDLRLPALDQHRDQVAADVVLGRLVLRVLGDDPAQHVRAEDVVAHRREDLVGRVRQPLRVLRLLAERGDRAAVGRRLDHAELVGLLDRRAQRRDRDAGAALDVLLDHLARVHAVDVVGAEHDHVVRALVVEQVEVLVDRVGRAGEPARAAAHLRGHGRHVVAQQRRERPAVAGCGGRASGSCTASGRRCAV